MTVRLAPSPTGRFHIGNLRTALVAQLWAQTMNWPLVVRFEDIDKPRVQQGAQERQLEDLNKIGIHNFKIEIQSQNHHRHWTAFTLGRLSGQIYPCFCSRKDLQNDLAGLASAPHVPLRAYSGKCRGLSKEDIELGRQNRSRSSKNQKQEIGWRFLGPDLTGAADVLVARSTSLEPSEEDFIPSYQWACSLDDALDGHRLLIRAWDLEDSIVPQRMIQNWLSQNPKVIQAVSPNLQGITSAQPPAVFHASLVTQPDGTRLEKRTPGVTLSDLNPVEVRQRLLESILRAPEVFKRDQYQEGRIWGEALRAIPWS
jgi:glutamyl-tRNA synthetase